VMRTGALDAAIFGSRSMTVLKTIESPISSSGIELAAFLSRGAEVESLKIGGRESNFHLDSV